jgi:hypothetical protein
VLGHEQGVAIASSRTVAFAFILAAMGIACLVLKATGSRARISSMLLSASVVLLMIGGILLFRAPQLAPSVEHSQRRDVMDAPKNGSSDPRAASRVATDLLRLIDPARDSISGNWSVEGASLNVSPSRFARLKIPYIPPESYELEIVAERTGGNNSFIIGLSQQGRQFAAVFDSQNRASGFDLVGGKPFYGNSTTVSRTVFQPGLPVTFLCSFKEDSIRVFVDGQAMLEWRGDNSQLSLYTDWSVGDPNSLFLGAFDSAFRITKIAIKCPAERRH